LAGSVHGTAVVGPANVAASAWDITTRWRSSMPPSGCKYRRRHPDQRRWKSCKTRGMNWRLSLLVLTVRYVSQPPPHHFRTTFAATAAATSCVNIVSHHQCLCPCPVHPSYCPVTSLPECSPVTSIQYPMRQRPAQYPTYLYPVNLYILIHTYLHACIDTCIHTNLPTYIKTYI